jgi:hypothetical protein
MEGRQKTMIGAGNETKDLQETHRNWQEDPNGDRETREVERRAGQPSGNKQVLVGKARHWRIH